MNFTELGIDSDITGVLAEKGIIDAFPIQEQTIPLALSGQDIIGQAKTGTGKTLGFGLPLLQRIGTAPTPGVKALVVTPTRELATQVYEDLELAVRDRETVVVPIYGGKGYEEQIKQIKDGAQVLVATPGRLIDLMNQRIISLSNVTEIVLDEADKMLDLGFLPDIERIFDRLPAVRHTMLFSATMPGPILNLARRFMSNPVHIRVTDPDEGITQKNIRHLVYRAHPLDKDEMIARMLQAEGREKAVIFMRTKRSASKLLDELRDRGFQVAAVHGDMNQEQRERSMAAFKAGKKDVLIATDVAARGIDVDDVTHVINYTIPDDEETYLHRVGRTGRAGRTGIAVTLIDWDDLRRWGLIAKALELGDDEPLETYSSSPHFYEELNIPEGTKGRLASAAPAVNARKSSRNSDGKSGGSSARKSSRPRRRTRRKVEADGSTPADASTQASDNAESSPAPTAGDANGESPRKPRRRRRRKPSGANGTDGGSAPTASDAATE
ncbi:DEAD/DEAH box helicase [Gulosibacter bifidus]|uniref:RNA helicase n=1 Tax=Gulosibacter bifidus TaxID=272239 RepID=A0ABW5RHP2_9MICO|nr:DEAD/DEAH box helicase [Gulosibacter bifidus]